MKPHVALVTQDFGGSGGSVTMTLFVHQALSDSGLFEPQVISLATSASDPNSVRLRSPKTWRSGIRCPEGLRNGIPFINVGAVFPEFEFQRYRPRAVLTEMLNGYDLVQFVVGTPPLMYAAARVERPKFLWTATMVRPDRASRLQQAHRLRWLWWSVMTPLAERYERSGLRIASEVFVLSHYTLAAVRRVLGPDAGILAPCGVDTEMFQPAPGAHNGQYILCVGRLDDHRKNTALLVEAYAQLRRKFPEAPELWLVGPQPPPQTMRLIREYELSNVVRLLGAKSAADLPKLYQSALFFVLSSDEEGLGIVILEAMACGLPVVSTACGGPETAIEHEQTGLLVPLNNAEALSAAMACLLNRPTLCATMGKAARSAALERFSIGATTRVFIEKYQQSLHAAGKAC